MIFLHYLSQAFAIDTRSASSPSRCVFVTEHKIGFADIGANFAMSALIARIAAESSFASPSSVSIFVNMGWRIGTCSGEEEGEEGEERAWSRDWMSSSMAWS